jgi:hypothetical protein
LFEPVHYPLIDKRVGHDLLDEDVPGKNMEQLGPELVAGILHSGVDMPEHDICFFVGFPDKYVFQILIGKKGKQCYNTQEYSAKPEHEFSCK